MGSQPLHLTTPSLAAVSSVETWQSLRDPTTSSLAPVTSKCGNVAVVRPLTRLWYASWQSLPHPTAPSRAPNAAVKQHLYTFQHHLVHLYLYLSINMCVDPSRLNQDAQLRSLCRG